MITIKLKTRQKTKELTHAAAIAALYVGMCAISASLGLSSGAIQLRLSEALCILPIYTSAAVPGLFGGCIIANLLMSGSVIDVVFGSLATFLGAVGTALIGKKHKILAISAPIVSNTVIIPFVLRYAYGVEDARWALFLCLFIGEVLSCGLLGLLLDRAIAKSISISAK